MSLRLLSLPAAYLRNSILPMIKAICTLSAIPLRKEASDRSEMTSQVLFGETFEVLEENEKWAMIRLDHDDYEGWIDRKQVSTGTSDGSSSAIVNTLLTFAKNESGELLVLPCGSYLPNFSGDQFSIQGHAYTLKTGLADQTGITIRELAMPFLNVPYLWGGRTFMGIDCSGFSQVVMRLCNTAIPRDAYQQAETGEIVSFIEEARTGDLAFFDNAEGRITHVGIVLVNDTDNSHKIIHASGKVRIDTLDHQGIFNAEMNTYSHKLRLIKRLLITSS